MSKTSFAGVYVGTPQFRENAMALRRISRLTEGAGHVIRDPPLAEEIAVCERREQKAKAVDIRKRSDDGLLNFDNTTSDYISHSKIITRTARHIQVP
jgi:hypothetical protein